MGVIYTVALIHNKAIRAVLGLSAAALMAVLPVAMNGVGDDSARLVVASVGGDSPPPGMTLGSTVDTTSPAPAPATAKAVPLVKAPHR
jgi:hypothetical protein